MTDNSNVVHLNGNETIRGERTFNVRYIPEPISDNNIIVSTNTGPQLMDTNWVRCNIEPISNVTESFKKMLNETIEELIND